MDITQYQSHQETAIYADHATGEKTARKRILILHSTTIAAWPARLLAAEMAAS